VPAGFFCGGLPVGIEFLGRPYSEAGALIKAAFGYERAARHRHPPPPLRRLRPNLELIVISGNATCSACETRFF
jgi:hypothetical protein